MPYGVQGLAFFGSGSSPRCAIQIRSGVSAYTAPTEPQVQPSCFTPSGSSGKGLGQFCASSYGPNSSCPPFSAGTACAAAVVAAGGGVLAGAAQPTTNNSAITASVSGLAT